MKHRIKVCYDGSGVKFTKVIGIVILVVSFIFFFVGIAFISYDVTFSIISFSMFISSLALSAVLQAISTIARAALYKCAVMESQYYFEEITPLQKDQLAEQERENAEKESEE